MYRRQINSRAIDPQSETIPLSRTRAVQRNPAVLLTDEVKDGEVGQRAPEDKFALRI
jgi:hypothetical protein